MVTTNQNQENVSGHTGRGREYWAEEAERQARLYPNLADILAAISQQQQQDQQREQSGPQQQGKQQQQGEQPRQPPNPILSFLEGIARSFGENAPTSASRPAPSAPPCPTSGQEGHGGQGQAEGRSEDHQSNRHSGGWIFPDSDSSESDNGRNNTNSNERCR